MIVKILTEHHLGCLSLKGDCRDSYESTHVKMPHCWKSHALAQNFMYACFLVPSSHGLVKKQPGYSVIGHI